MFEHQMGGNVMRNFNYGRATTTQSKPTSEITDNIIRKTSKITNWNIKTANLQIKV